MGNTDKFEMIADTYDTPERIQIAKVASNAIREYLVDSKSKNAIDFGCGTGLVERMYKNMREFLLVFRMDITTPEAQPTPAQMEVYMKQWNDWTSGIAKQDRLAGGNHLSVEGRVIKPNNEIEYSPYIENKESIAGYIIIRTNSFEEAVHVAKACPILLGEGTSVEVREIASM